MYRPNRPGRNSSDSHFGKYAPGPSDVHRPDSDSGQTGDCFHGMQPPPGPPAAPSVPPFNPPMAPPSGFPGPPPANPSGIPGPRFHAPPPPFSQQGFGAPQPPQSDFPDHVMQPHWPRSKFPDDKMQTHQLQNDITGQRMQPHEAQNNFPDQRMQTQEPRNNFPDQRMQAQEPRNNFPDQRMQTHATPNNFPSYSMQPHQSQNDFPRQPPHSQDILPGHVMHPPQPQTQNNPPGHRMQTPFSQTYNSGGAPLPNMNLAHGPPSFRLPPPASSTSPLPPHHAHNYPPAQIPPRPPATNHSTPQSSSAFKKEDAGDIDSEAQREVKQWLQAKGKLKKGDTTADKVQKMKDMSSMEGNDHSVHGKVSIGSAQNKLRSVLHALAAVQGELQQLEEQQGTADTETWERGVSKIKDLKAAYIKTKETLDCRELIQLKGKLDRRKKTRARQKRRRQEEREAEQQVLFERAQKHVAIDQWQDRIRQEYLKQQEMKRLKETADKTLSKVRREIREVRKMLDTVTRLQKLRAIRNDTAEKRGQTFPSTVADHFEEKTGDLIQLLTQQMEGFEKEEAALKLILETEKEEAKEKEKEEKRQKEKDLRKRELEEEKQSLFGGPVTSFPGDPMEPFIHYYQQAQYSLPALQNIRQEWDTFLVSDRVAMASRVPDGWVVPDSPASAVWASVLHNSS